MVNHTFFSLGGEQRINMQLALSIRKFVLLLKNSIFVFE